MKTLTTTSTRPDHKHSQSSTERARQYAAYAILSLILRKYYTDLAKSMKLRTAQQAAIKDYLDHEREFRLLNKEL
jgi:hypothetical protein